MRSSESHPKKSREQVISMGWEVEVISISSNNEIAVFQGL